MDPTVLPPEVVATATELLPNGAFWLFVVGVATTWWKSIAAHLCELIGKTLSIAEKFADNGLDIRLSITNLDGDPPRATPEED